jgi:hypothetical protein
VAAALGLADTVHRRSAVALSVPVLALVWLAPASWLAPRISPYKSLSQALRVEGARLVDVRSSPVSQIAVVESPVVPLRHAPGLSLAAPREPPEQTGLFVDAGGVTAIARELDAESLSYLDYTTAALPYHVAPPSAVLVLGVGGGEGILRAALLGAERIVGVELDPWLARLAGEAYGGFTGEPFPGGGVTLARADIRGWVASGEERFDLVEHVAPGELGGGGPVLASLAEGYLYTTEAIEGYLERVRPSGLLALTTWMKNPPRDHVKLAAAAVGALERLGRAPAERLAAIRGWQTATLLIKPTPFTAAELEALRAFCRARLFDVVYYPGMREEEANRYNRLPEPAAHRALVALLGPERHRFLAAYPFDVAPATDDRPFFHQFFRWRTLPSILESRGRGGLSLLEAGYLVLVVTLLQGLVLGGLLILVPWLALRRETRAGAGEGMARTVVYFGALGLGFLALEIAFLQKLVLLLHHPVYSSAAVLAGFLVFAGLGSAASARLERRFGSRAVALAAACVVAIGLVDLWLLRAVVPALTGHPLVVRVSVALAMIAPLALPMGMLFPLGLARIRRLSERLVPWAWAINGSASVVSPIAATLLAVHLGFSAVVAGALVCYAVAGVVFGRAAVGARENLASG